MSDESAAESFEALTKLYDTAMRDRGSLEEKLALFQSLVEMAPAVLWTANKDGSITFASKKWTEISGATLEETVGDQFTSFIDPADRHRAIAVWADAVKRGTTFETEYRVMCLPSGQSRWFSVKGIALKNAQGEVDLWIGCAMDVHDQRLIKEELAKRVSELSALNKEAELAKQLLAQSELMFRTMCESSAQLMWIADGEGRCTYFNAAYYAYTGSNLNESRGDGWLNYVAESNKETAKSIWDTTVERGTDLDSELLLRRADNDYRWHAVKGVAIRDDQGKVIRWVGSAIDIETHRRMVSELEQERDKAESALAVKSEFVANVSHELRTPMNGILGMVQVLLRTQELSPTVKEYVLTIKEAGDALLSIINDLLDFSKADAGKMELSASEFDLISMIEGVGDILVPQSANKNILLITNIEGALPRRIVGDPLRLRQILLNLAGNAVKFTDDGIVIIRANLLSVEGDKINIQFSVSDSGIGIADHHRQNLFEPFVQADGSSHRTATGTGLGLAICKRLVDLMDGSLTVDSVEGSGSTFSFSVALLAAPGSLMPDPVRAKLAALPYEILTLEPTSNRGFVIEEKLLMLGVKTRSFSQPAELLDALDLIENNILSSSSADTAFDAAQTNLAGFDKKEPIAAIVLLDEIRTSKLAHNLAVSLRERPGGQHLPIIHLDGSDPDVDNDPASPDIVWHMPVRRDDLVESLLHLTRSDVVAAEGQSDSSEDLTKKQNPRISRIQLEAMPTSPEFEITIKVTKRVLVADDNKINLQVARLFLEALELTVDVVDDGIAAVTAFKACSYDLVILDCQMPVLDGFESCRIIKEIQSRKGRRIPVIAMTAHAIAGSKENCLARGFDDYMSKPIEPAELEKIVRFWLGMSDAKISGSHKKFDPPSQAEIDERNSSIMAKLSESTNLTPRTAIDMTLLKSRFNEKNIRSLFQLFLDSYIAEIDELAKAAAAADWVKVKDRAHAFKGACGTICATTISGFLADLEKACNGAEDHTRLAILEEIKLELGKAVDEVQAYVAVSPPT